MSEGIALRQVDHRTAAEITYDVVVVGSGVSGAIMTRVLAERGLRVLVLEAGEGHELSLSEYEGYLTHFYGSAVKDNNAPYAHNANADMPRSPEVRRVQDDTDDHRAYMVQTGALAMDSTYTRVLGGTTMHWEGKALRMLPEDFELQTRFGVGRDWPISYDALAPYYNRAENELGVSGDVEDQDFGGITFDPGYVYPMTGMPLSHLDKVVARDLDGTQIELAGEAHTLTVRGTPQARNGIPNPDYDGGKGYVPVGAVSTHQVEEGGRCQGNINCVPLCPVQAKYNARKTLAPALATGRVDILTQTVASRVNVGEDGRVSSIDYQAYGSSTSPEHTTGTVRARAYVLAANPVENARLMLASGLPGSNGLVGRNLMDHAYLLTWGLLPEVAGTMRGSQCTGGVEELRGGAFRRDNAAVRLSIHNDGWGWATGAPYTDLAHLVDDHNRFGADLRAGLVDRISRQLLLSWMVELLPDPDNRVTIDPRYTDQLGNPRPVVSFTMSDYTIDGIAMSRQVSRRIFQRLGAEDHTSYDPLDPGFTSHRGEGYVIRGGNHWAGTHIMGTSAHDSVVDTDQRSWEHDNLHLVGPGSMPTIGTANTTLTLAALCFRTADRLADQLTSRPTLTIAG